MIIKYRTHVISLVTLHSKSTIFTNLPKMTGTCPKTVNKLVQINSLPSIKNWRSLTLDYMLFIDIEVLNVIYGSLIKRFQIGLSPHQRYQRFASVSLC